MNYTPNEVQAIQADIRLGEAVERLRKNKDFKLIVNDMFLDGGAINLAKNINVVKKEQQENVIEQIKSRGFLYRFLMELEEAAEQGRMALAEGVEDGRQD